MRPTNAVSIIEPGTSKDEDEIKWSERHSTKGHRHDSESDSQNAGQSSFILLSKNGKPDGKSIQNGSKRPETKCQAQSWKFEQSKGLMHFTNGLKGPKRKIER